MKAETASQRKLVLLWPALGAVFAGPIIFYSVVMQ